MTRRRVFTCLCLLFLLLFSSPVADWLKVTPKPWFLESRYYYHDWNLAFSKEAVEAHLVVAAFVATAIFSCWLVRRLRVG